MPQVEQRQGLPRGRIKEGMNPKNESKGARLIIVRQATLATGWLNGRNAGKGVSCPRFSGALISPFQVNVPETTPK